MQNLTIVVLGVVLSYLSWFGFNIKEKKKLSCTLIVSCFTGIFSIIILRKYTIDSVAQMLENLYVREMHGWWVVFFAKQANVDWITSRYYLVYIVYVCGCIPIRRFIVKQEMYLQVINRFKTSIWFLFLNQHKY